MSNEQLTPRLTDEQISAFDRDWCNGEFNPTDVEMMILCNQAKLVNTLERSLNAAEREVAVRIEAYRSIDRQNKELSERAKRAEAALVARAEGMPEMPEITQPIIQTGLTRHVNAHDYFTLSAAFKRLRTFALSLTAELAKEREDAGRLDHLEKYSVIAKPGQPIRAAIDESIAAIDAAIAKGASHD